MTAEILVHQTIPAVATAAALLIAPDGRTATTRLRTLFGRRRSSLDGQWRTPAQWLLRPGRTRRATGHRSAGHRALGRRSAAGRSAVVREPAGSRLRHAAGWDVLAACLLVGLPVPRAVDAAADELSGAAANALHRVAELLRLGADPEQAWAPALARPELNRLARRARRAAQSGAALAEAAGTIAAELRIEAQHAAEAGAQRAGVLITGPLGLCFLPAFLCLGVVPVVIGLATRLLQSW